jgi:hypothetical protein
MLQPGIKTWQPIVCRVSGRFYKSHRVNRSRQHTSGEALKAPEVPNVHLQHAPHVVAAGVGANLTMHADFIRILGTECGNSSEILEMRWQ